MVNKFEFDKKELSSPESFLSAMSRLVEQTKNQKPFDLLDTSVFYNQVTNMYHYEEDAWFDMVHEPSNFSQLEEFMTKLNTLQGELSGRNVNKVFTPLIIMYAAENNAKIKGLVRQDPNATGLEPMKHTESTVSVMHR